MSLGSFIGNEAKIIIGGVETGAADALHFLTGATTVIEKGLSAEPKVVAALGVLAAGVSKLLTDSTTQPFSLQELADVKAVWSDIVTFAAALGIKI
jgi:hypothetical protein